VSKNWPNDRTIDCRLPSNLVEMIEKHLNFEKELEKLNFWTYKMLEEEFMCFSSSFAFCKF
jgi:hypothetical protein